MHVDYFDNVTLDEWERKRYQYRNEKSKGLTQDIDRWGLSLGETEGLGERIAEYWDVYGALTSTKTRDTSHYGYHYLSGLLRMETERTMANNSRQAGVSEQNMQHYMSKSPWSGHRVIEKVASDIVAHPYFATDTVLLLDESADDKAGKSSAGAGRQYNGRRGKVDMCQVGVFVSIAKQGMNCWIDGEIFIPEHWFDDVHTEFRAQVGIAEERIFQTKPELGWDLIERAQARGMPFTAVACDSLYGRSFWFRSQLATAKLESTWNQ